MEQETENQPQEMMNVSTLMNSINRRVRVLEERNNHMHRKTAVIEENMISNHKEVSEKLKKMNDDIKEIKKDFQEVKESMNLIVREIQSKAKKDDVDYLRKYIDLWNPTDFVTNNELDKAVKRILGKK
jgi:predicted transcriptional regulator